MSFALFGLGALVLAALLFPLIWIWPAKAEAKTAFIQRGVHYAFRLFLWFVEVIGLMEFRFKGAEALRQSGPGLVVANHPTLLDVVMLISRLPQADCIVKKELWDNFFLRGIVTCAGYLPNVDGPELVATAVEKVRQGRKLIIFPEGTRSLPTGLKPFTHGFAQIAVRAPCTLFPVFVTCQPPALYKGHGIFEVPETKARLEASFEGALVAKSWYEAADPVPVAVRKVVSQVRNYFEEKVPYDGLKDA